MVRKSFSVDRLEVGEIGTKISEKIWRFSTHPRRSDASDEGLQFKMFNTVGASFNVITNEIPLSFV